LAPACVGIWIVLPSIEALIVPADYRGPFGRFLTLMLPGLFCFSLGQFSINAIFQIARKTMPMVLAALATCVADPLFVWLLPRGGDASTLALAQSLAMAVGLVVLIAFAQANRPQWPRFRDIALSVLACLGMAALAGPLRSLRPGLALMATQIVLAGSFWLLAVAGFDIAGLRSAFMSRAQPWFARKGRVFKVFLPL
jgi:hypothetical protein